MTKGALCDPKRSVVGPGHFPDELILKMTPQLCAGATDNNVNVRFSGRMKQLSCHLIKSFPPDFLDWIDRDVSAPLFHWHYAF